MGENKNINNSYSFYDDEFELTIKKKIDFEEKVKIQLLDGEVLIGESEM